MKREKVFNIMWYVLLALGLAMIVLPHTMKWERFQISENFDIHFGVVFISMVVVAVGLLFWEGNPPQRPKGAVYKERR